MVLVFLSAIVLIFVSVWALEVVLLNFVVSLGFEWVLRVLGLCLRFD